MISTHENYLLPQKKRLENKLKEVMKNFSWKTLNVSLKAFDVFQNFKFFLAQYCYFLENQLFPKKICNVS